MVCGEEMTGIIFGVECWCCRTGGISDGVLGGGLGLTGRRGERFWWRGGRESVESFRARKTYQL